MNDQSSGQIVVDSRDIMEVPLNWRRYWQPIQGDPNHVVEDQGFLPDPEVLYSRLLIPKAFTLAELANHKCLVLCGEPGMGKSVTLEQVRATITESAGDQKLVFWRSFHRDLLSCEDLLQQLKDFPAWKSWIENDSDLSIVIDGVDEGLVAAPQFVGRLITELRDGPIERLRLTLTCRAADWPKSEGDELLRLWPADSNTGVYSLKHLRAKDACEAARLWSGSEDRAKKFLHAIIQLSIEPLAARPITLKMLFKEFSLSGDLPKGRTDLYRRACERMCEEDAKRLRRLKSPRRDFSPQELYTCTSRIAARMLLGKRSGITEAPVESRSAIELGVQDVLGPDGSRADMERVQTAISTAIFMDAGRDRRIFAHPTFGEFMASEHLSGLSLPQVLRLLTIRHGNLYALVPQLKEVAAWLAINSPEFRKWLIEIEPENFLRNDVSTLPDDAKRDIVVSYLRRAAREESFDEWGLERFYAGLNYSDLAGDVTPYIANARLNTVVRRLAIHLADSCACRETLDECLKVALNPSDDSHIREQAMNAVARRIPPERLSEIEPLALGELGPDPHDELRGIALELLVPRHWSVSRTIDLLNKRNDPNFVGKYSVVIAEHLPNNVELQDLTSLFGLLANVDLTRQLHRSPAVLIADKAMSLAVRNFKVATVRSSFLQFLKKKLAGNGLSHENTDIDWNRNFSDSAATRHDFFLALIDEGGLSEAELNSFQFRLPILAEDCQWVFDQLKAAFGAKRDSWSYLASRYWGVVQGTPQMEVFLYECARSPEVCIILNWPLCSELGGDFERFSRDMYKWRQAASNENSPKKPIVTAKQYFEDALGRAKTDSKFWLDLSWSLQREKDELEISSFLPDLTQRRLFRESSPEVQAEIIRIAEAFLLEHTFEPEKGKFIQNYQTPGTCAIWLLRDAIPNRPTLAKAVKEKWLGALLDRELHHSREAQELKRLAIMLDPERCRVFFSAQLESEITRGGYLISSLSAFQAAWDQSLSSVVIQFLEARNVPSTALLDALTHLAKHDPAVLKSWIRQKLPHIRTKVGRGTGNSSVLAAVALGCFPEEFWDKIWPKVKSNRTFARDTFTHLIFALVHRQLDALRKWTERQLASIYLQLEQVFPSSQDPEYASGEVTAGDNRRDFRRYLRGTLESRGTLAACDEFKRLAAKLPTERTWLMWERKNAFTKMLKNDWRGIEPGIFSALESRSEARLVENQDDLFELVLDSLQRFQDQLPSVAYRLWNLSPKPSPKPEKILSREIYEWLRTDLGPKNQIVAGCEVQPSLSHANDIVVWAHPNGTKTQPNAFCVVLEVKRHFHSKVASAIENQLVADYLLKYNRTHGIYVTGWYNCPSWHRPSPLKVKNRTEAEAKLHFLTEKSQRKHTDFRLASVCLDCGYATGVCKRHLIKRKKL